MSLNEDHGKLLLSNSFGVVFENFFLIHMHNSKKPIHYCYLKSLVLIKKRKFVYNYAFIFFSTIFLICYIIYAKYFFLSFCLVSAGFSILYKKHSYVLGIGFKNKYERIPLDKHLKDDAKKVVLKVNSIMKK